MEGREGSASHKTERSEVDRPAAKHKETSVSSALISLGDGEGTGTGRECILSIVAVNVKVAKRTKPVLTYAFLDPGSSATF